ncbi:MAG: DUF58 domain-containing protein [Cyanobacteria bacterium J069]
MINLLRRPFTRLMNWLEGRWVAPAYSGWVAIGLALFFFGAATNTMAGWLYATSGLMGALLVLGAVLPGRSLRTLTVRRLPIEPVSVGEVLTLALMIENTGRQDKTLLQVGDRLPAALGPTATTVIESLAGLQAHRWQYTQTAEKRGVYRWNEVILRSATPLGLFWGRRSHAVSAVAVVYPAVLPLSQCPLIDEMGQDLSRMTESQRRAQMATEGVTRTLRPYRWGDPTRLIHWRTSARYGELRLRELERFTGGQDVMIALDSAGPWQEATFEQAVTAAASLYTYALRQGMTVSLWTAESGALRGDRLVLEALAAVQPGGDSSAYPPTQTPILWLTQSAASCATLAAQSRWLLWQPTDAGSLDSLSTAGAGLTIQPAESLLHQLQRPPYSG